MKSFNSFVTEAAAPASSKSSKFCCEEFEAALAASTGPAISANTVNKKQEYEISPELKPIKFCPWCGAKVKR